MMLLFFWIPACAGTTHEERALHSNLDTTSFPGSRPAPGRQMKHDSGNTNILANYAFAPVLSLLSIFNPNWVFI
jgi:hypothetical protein